jgi:hypothetical protein
VFVALGCLRKKEGKGIRMKATVARVFVAVLAAALVAGCAMGPKGPSDEELIKGQLEVWKAGLAGNDIDKLMSTYSEKFYNAEVGGKAEVKEFLSQAMESGYTEKAEIDWSQAKFEPADGNIKVYPITVASAAGSVTVELTFTKEKAGKTANWLITGMEIEGA